MNRSYQALAVLTLFAVACEGPTVPAPDTGPSPLQRVGAVPQDELAPTPLQSRLARRLMTRAARHERTPRVAFEFQSAQGASLSELARKKYLPGGGFSYTAKTVMRYASPRDAGLARWPEMTLSPAQQQKLGMTSEQFKAQYIAKMEAASPGIWQRYEFGTEPRTYSIVETETRTYPLRNLRSTKGINLMGSSAALTEAAAIDATSGNLVFGFSLILPSLHKKIKFTLEEPISGEDIESAEFTFDAEFGAGLRLPMQGAMSGEEPVNEGDTFGVSSVLAGQDWAGSQYADVGLPAQDGHEAYFIFQVQACVDFDGVINPDPYCVGPNEQQNTDFTTLLGGGNLIDLPTVKIPVLDYGIAGIKVVVNSAVGSDNVSANYAVGGEGIGSGALSYANSGTPISVPDIYANDGPGNAAITVNAFQYNFNQFTVTPGVNLWVELEIPLAPDFEIDETFELFTINLFDILDLLGLPSGIGIPIHASPYSGGSSLALNVEIVNVAPTAALAIAGGSTQIIQGQETQIANTGDNFSFTLTSHDPGRDDLTLRYDWDDGAPAPDVTVVDASGPTGPNDALDVQNKAFTQACVYNISASVTDDDGASASDGGTIVVTQSGQLAKLEGYWQTQYSQTGSTLLSPGVLQCYIEIIELFSAVFSEQRSISTFADAVAVLNLPQNGGSAQEQLDRDLLVAWLAFAAGAIQYDQLVDTDRRDGPDTPYKTMMAAAEAVRSNAAATDAQRRAQSQKLHDVVVQFVR